MCVCVCVCPRRELYHHGITVHSIEPGAYDTNLFDNDAHRKSLTRVYEAASPYLQRLYGDDFVEKCTPVAVVLSAI